MAEELPAEDKWRSAIEDALTVVNKLRPLCNDLDQVAGMMQLALSNDGQLRMMIQLIAKKSGGKLP